MKKYLACLLTMSILLFASGCGSQSATTDTEIVEIENTEDTAIASVEPTEGSEASDAATAEPTDTSEPSDVATTETADASVASDSSNKASSTEGTSPITIYLTRHGKTMLNTTDRVQGWADSPLTAPGVEVAQQLGKGLKAKNVEFDGVYTSDSGRAVETATIVIEELGQTGLPIRESKKLREWNFGGFEGDLNANMTAAIEKDAGLENDPETSVMVRVPMNELADHIASADETKTAENWEALSTRINAGFQEVIDSAIANNEENILIVVHGLTINSILKDIDPAFTTVQVPNAAVAKIVYENGQCTIETFNDTSYLE